MTGRGEERRYRPSKYLIILGIISTLFLLMVHLDPSRIEWDRSREVILVILILGSFFFSLYILFIPVKVIMLDHKIERALIKKWNIRIKIYDDHNIGNRKRRENSTINDMTMTGKRPGPIKDLILKNVPIILIMLSFPFWLLLCVRYLMSETGIFYNGLFYYLFLIDIFIIMSGYFMIKTAEYILKTLLLEFIRTEYSPLVESILRSLYPMISEQEKYRKKTVN